VVEDVTGTAILVVSGNSVPPKMTVTHALRDLELALLTSEAAEELAPEGMLFGMVME
jgi:hypothetical protein